MPWHLQNRSYSPPARRDPASKWCLIGRMDWTHGLDGHETEKKEGIETDQRRTADTRNEKRVALLPLLGNVMIHTSEDLGLKL